MCEKELFDLIIIDFSHFHGFVFFFSPGKIVNGLLVYGFLVIIIRQ